MTHDCLPEVFQCLRSEAGSEFIVFRCNSQVYRHGIYRGAPYYFWDGEQTRDFTFVGDVVEANLLAANSNDTGVFNIGRGERMSINSID